MVRRQGLRIPLDGSEFDALVLEQLAVSDQALDLGRLEQAGNATRQLADDACTSFLHGGDIHFDVARADPVLFEIVLRAVIKL